MSYWLYGFFGFVAAAFSYAKNKAKREGRDGSTMRTGALHVAKYALGGHFPTPRGLEKLGFSYVKLTFFKVSGSMVAPTRVLHSPSVKGPRVVNDGVVRAWIFACAAVSFDRLLAVCLFALSGTWQSVFSGVVFRHPERLKIRFFLCKTDNFQGFGQNRCADPRIA